MKYAPIFSKDNKEFFFLCNDLIFDRETDATKTGVGMAIVECILMGCKYTGKVFSWNPADDPQMMQGNFGEYRVAFLG